RERIPRRQATSAPLSFGQRALWAFQRLQPDTACYNSAAAFRVEGRADAEALDRSLVRLMRRHDVLRSLVGGGDDPVLEVAPEPASVLATVDLRALGAAAAERAAWGIAMRDATVPFDLERGPLVRAALLRTAETAYLLVVDVHHIAVDAWS